MATYKVIQDIEAEDKILGPLTLRQFIYSAIAALCLYLSYFMVSKHATILIIIFLPVALVSGFFAFPWRRDQPTEIWALAKIRFLFMPRRRIWDQSGVKQLVTITAPKQIEVNYTDNLSETEVRSRLKALADTIDSRGWAVKDVSVNLATQPLMTTRGHSDRLVDVNNFIQAVPAVNIQAADDILDEHYSPVAQNFDRKINALEQAHRQNIVQNLQQVNQQIPTSADHQPQTPPISNNALPNDYWFMNQPSTSPPAGYTTFGSNTVAPTGITTTNTDTNSTPTADEQAILRQLNAQQAKTDIAYSHLRTVKPSDVNQPAAPQPITSSPNPDIMNLAENNDFNIATLARQAKKSSQSDDEVVISLH